MSDLETKLITILDIKDFKPLSGNTDTSKKVDPFILEAQEFELRPILGDEFYLDLLDDFNASPSLTKYNDLFNGSRYTCGTIQYENPGLKSVLVYYSYARYLNNSNTNSTPFGMVEKLNSDSKSLSEKALSRLVSQAVSGAKAYEFRVVDFLRRNSEDFPLYRCEKDNGKTGGLRISSVRKGSTRTHHHKDHHNNHRHH